jgi:hypothetical protein
VRRAIALVLGAALLAGACGQDRPAADDAGLHQAVANGRDGTEVTFDATVASEPAAGGSHERFQVQAATGETLEVDHNASLAPWVPAHLRDELVIHGSLYIDPGPRAGVHCTHARTSRGCPVPGWIMLAGRYYE